jgi:putative flavoprotein involved in K+ transport
LGTDRRPLHDAGHDGPEDGRARRRRTGLIAETIVIGAGQAGLSVSRLLRDRAVDHVVLEQGRVGETWRSHRWDGFYLNTPNWATRLPGKHYDGPSPDAFAPRDEIVAYLVDYARDAPVREHTRVVGARPVDGGWRVETDHDVLDAANVVVATGAFQRPHLPAPARDVPPDVMSLHSSEYRNPQQLPAGTVLVVGSAQSGCQIADELIDAGRDVVLAVGRCGWFPRRYRGRDLIAWGIELGMMEDPVESLPSPTARLGCNPALSGNDGGRDCHPRFLAARGATLAGRIASIGDGVVRFAPDLDESLAFGDEFFTTFLHRVDEHVAAAGLDLPEPDPRPETGEPASVDALRLRDLGAIVWATGYRPDFSWLDAPVDDMGWPVQSGGVAPLPGLFYVGLHWLRVRKSALLLGVGDDAAHVVAQL